MDRPLLKATSTGRSAQAPVPSDPVTAQVSIAGGGGLGPFHPVTVAPWTCHSSLLNSASTGPGTLAPWLHLPLLTRIWVTAHAHWRRNAGQELAVKWPQAPVISVVHTLNLSDLEAPAAVSGALAPVSHFPAGTGTEVALLGRVRSLDGCAVGVYVGAAFHAPPVGPQPARGGALTPVSNNPVRRASAHRELLVIRCIQQKPLSDQACCILLRQTWPGTLCQIHAARQF